MPQDLRKPVSFLFKILFIFFALLLAFAVLEGFLRLAGFGYKLLNPIPQNQGADYRIFCVGESSTTGTGTVDPLTQSYPKQLEVLLSRSFPDKKIQCFFDRTIGWNSSEILLKFPSYLEKYDPNLVILMVGVNNWWNMERSNILLFSKNDIISDLTLKILIFLDNFRVWKLIKWIRFSLGGFKSRWGYWTPEAERIDDVIKRDGIRKMMLFNKLAEYDLSEMVKICRTNNIKVIMASYPMGAWGHLDMVQRKIASEYGIPFVDNDAVFKSLSNVSDYLWKDGWHPNKKGYSIVARNFHDCIVREGLLH